MEVILIESPPEVGAAQRDVVLADQPRPEGTPGFAPEDVPAEQRPTEVLTRSADPPTIPGTLQIVALPSGGEVGEGTRRKARSEIRGALGTIIHAVGSLQNSVFPTGEVKKAPHSSSPF